tara:strand:- start:278 stop:640 length:363 start_codon:yes stop_codon:yes gene_type:complete
MANLPSTKKTTTSTDVFDSYNTNESITATTGEYDAVMGFFLQKTEGNSTIASSLTDTVIQIATNLGDSPMIIIDELAEYGLTDIQQSIISLLNQTRNDTSMLGFNKSQAPNNLVARNILS